MKKASKIVSLALVLIMLLSVAVVPTSAADAIVTTGLELVKATDEEVTAYDDEYNEVAVKASSLTDGDIYKLVVKLSSTKPLLGINIGITYDQSVFAPCSGGTIEKGTYKIWGYAINDADMIGGSLTAGSLAAARPVGQFADTNKYKADGSIFEKGPAAQYAYSGMFISTESTEYVATDSAQATRDNVLGAGCNTGITGNAETDGVIMLQQTLSGTKQNKPLKAFKAVEQEPVWEIFFKTAPGADVSGKRFTVAYLSTSTYVGEADIYSKENAVAIPAASALGCEYTVGAATAESIIKNGGNQIRFRGVGIDGNFSAYQNVFDVRTVAKISPADFKAKFGATDAEALEKIKDIGFVFAPMSETFEMDAAIALAKKDTTGQVSEGIYTKKPCKYIGHESDNADYIFTCIVENIEDTTANRANGFTCLAYACDVDGNYYFFDAAATANYQDLFTAHFKG